MRSFPLARLALPVLLLVSCHAFAQEQKSGYDEKGGYYRTPTTVFDKDFGDTLGDFDYDATRGATDGFTQEMRARKVTEDRMKALESGKEQGRQPDAITKDSFQQLLAKANGGDAMAIGEVGRAYQKGLGVDKDPQKAIEWYTNAAERGQPQYWGAIGDMYRSEGQKEQGLLGKLKNFGSGELDKDDVKAREFYEKGAKYDDPQSLMNLGIMYRDGTGGLEKDTAIARAFYNRGVESARRDQVYAELKAYSALSGEARRAEGIDLAAAPKTTDGAAPAAASQTVTVSGGKCTYGPSATVARGFATVYDANCAGVPATPSTHSVEMAGLLCTVQASGLQNPSHRFYCNVGQKPDIMLGQAACVLQGAGMEGNVTTYNANCGSPVPDAMTMVNYLGQDCTVIPNRTAAVLRCVPPGTKGLTVKLGTYMCALTPLTPPAEGLFAQYDAACGGLTAEAKAGKDIPKTTVINARNCRITPNTTAAGKDFNVDCE